MNSTHERPRTAAQRWPRRAALGTLLTSWVLVASRPDPTGPGNLKDSPVHDQRAGTFSPLPAPAERLPGVLSLPPATHARDARAPTGTRHLPPPADAGRFTLEDWQAQTPRRNDGTFLVEVPTLHFSASDPAARSVIEGQSVETTAQLHRSPLHPALTTLARSLTHCCTADARDFTIPLELPGEDPLLPDGAWVIVTGTIRYRPDPAGYRAVLCAKNIRVTDPPLNPLLK
jgi:hypothetical protein